MSLTEEWKDSYTDVDIAREKTESEKDANRKSKPTKSLNDYDVEYNQILQEMMNRKEIDKLNME